MLDKNNKTYNDDFTKQLEYAKINYPWTKEDIAFDEQWIFMLGELIDKRKELGLSQRDIARMINKPQSTIARIEACKTVPNTETLFKLVNALGLTIVIK